MRATFLELAVAETQRLVEHQLGIAGDGHELVVQLVGDAAGERFEQLGLGALRDGTLTTRRCSRRASKRIGATCVRGREHADVLWTEDARIDSLDDQHALQQPARENRNTEERVIAILAGVGKVLEAGMRGGVSDELRLNGLGDKADEPFIEPHAHLAHALVWRPMVAESTRLARSKSSMYSEQTSVSNRRPIRLTTFSRVPPVTP